VPISPVVQISLKRNKDFLNTEFVTFLRYIEKTGSMNGACQKMGIAYSRAWTMINQAENQLGYPLIQRLAGGKGGGSSVITPQCLQLIERFEVFSNKLNAEASRIFKELF
jgi:molybdate transport repressor ModE-like protein